jgi:hypothetical protein
MRVIVRRRRLYDHEQPTRFDTNGYRYSCFVTNTPATGAGGLDVQYADARHRVHARVEDDVRTTQDTGLGRLPSKFWAVNMAWCAAVCIAVDLIAWFRRYALTGALAKAEPKPPNHTQDQPHEESGSEHGVKICWAHLTDSSRDLHASNRETSNASRAQTTMSKIAPTRAASGVAPYRDVASQLHLWDYRLNGVTLLCQIDGCRVVTGGRR